MNIAELERELSENFDKKMIANICERVGHFRKELIRQGFDETEAYELTREYYFSLLDKIIYQ